MYYLQRAGTCDEIAKKGSTRTTPHPPSLSFLLPPPHQTHAGVLYLSGGVLPDKQHHRRGVELAVLDLAVRRELEVVVQVIPLLRPRHIVPVQLLQPPNYEDGRRVIAIVAVDARLIVAVEAATNG
jgi:hypothetical protein